MNRCLLVLCGVIAAIALAAFGCKTARLVDYTPTANLTVPEAKFHIQRMIEEDPKRLEPAEVEVTDAKIKVTRHKVVRRVVPSVGGVTRLPIISLIYFADIGELEFYTKSDVYWVRIWDKSGEFWMKIFSYHRGRVEQLIDALELMISVQTDLTEPQRTLP